MDYLDPDNAVANPGTMPDPTYGGGPIRAEPKSKVADQ